MSPGEHSQQSLVDKIQAQAFSWVFIGVAASVANPIDFVRFRMQVMPELIQMGHLSRPYQGPIDCAKRVLKQQGYCGFWKGNLSNLMRVVPMETLVFILKEQLQKTFHYHQRFNESKHVLINSVIGVSATAFFSTLLYPFEFVRQKIANRTDRRKVTILEETKKNCKRGGIKELYHGAGLHLSGLLAFRALYFGIYDSLKVKTQDLRLRFISSYFACYVGLIVTFPIDGIRRRKVTNRQFYTGVWQCVTQIIKREGIQGFYHGWQTVWVQSMAWASFYYLYDSLFTDYKEALDF